MTNAGTIRDGDFTAPNAEAGLPHEAARSPKQSIMRIHAENYDRIFSYCASRLGSTQLAEDATSAVFVDMVRRFSELQAKTGMQMRTWLYGTAANKVRTHYRDSANRREAVAKLARIQRTQRPASSGFEKLDWPVVQQALGKLKQHEQDIIVLRFYQDLETSEIAEALGMKHVTVRVTLSRAIKKLRRELGEYLDK